MRVWSRGAQDALTYAPSHALCELLKFVGSVCFSRSTSCYVVVFGAGVMQEDAGDILLYYV